MFFLYTCTVLEASRSKVIRETEGFCTVPDSIDSSGFPIRFVRLWQTPCQYTEHV